MDRQTFSELVCAIYDGALDHRLWPEILGRICGALGFRKGTIDLNRLPGMTNLFNFHHGIDAAQAATMVSHYRAMPEVWGGLAATMVRPIDRPWIVSRILSPEALRQTAYYRAWVGPMALVDGAALVLARDQSLFGSIRLATDARRGIIDDALVEALALLLPHCQRAARISGLLDASQTAARDFAAVIEAMSVPILLVSAECALVHANARGHALLEEGGVLAARHGRLTSTVPGLHRAIGDTVRRLAEDETELPGAGTGLSIRAGEQDARTLHLLPLARGTLRARLAGDAVAAIFVSTPARSHDLARDVMIAMFELTKAEADVFERIVGGIGTREIADQLGIAASTVRTHVQHLFQKTATLGLVDEFAEHPFVYVSHWRGGPRRGAGVRRVC